ncbi:vitamin K epoxide reductase family protein [Aquimarina sp. 2201CG14-23]|uniref:vitamin K epoxide reductase family protein n=1 Tax=Aquimarina mycalae TaxID=3040073 RepID=UPI002477D40F|nr:vitamin K epoxide reductase family protein [Aquimarina sp. 2201CG14-23]MDH7445378.1 vitamin K epoxide reductase family protein [Aquimarina sp. 2201CG14-23]
MKEQLHTILKKLIIKNNIRIHKEELQLQLSSHPSYPSLHALTGVLDHFNIPNLALRVSVNPEILRNLPTCFIANMTLDAAEELVLVQKRNGKIKITTTANNVELIEEKDFLSRWNGVILAIEKNENIKETKTSIYATATINRILVVLVGICVGYFLIMQPNFFAQTHFVLSAMGLIISVFIVKHELGLQSSAANQFCNLSENTNCDTVLNSKGATIFKLFKLSDASIVTFATYCLSWMLFFISEANGLEILSIVTLMAFPFVVYSVYYQYQVIKKWCPLCLGIAIVLVFQFMVVAADNFSSITLIFDSQEVLILVLSLTSVIGAWNLLKPLIEKKESLQKTEITHYTFKRKFSLFKALYDESENLSEVNHFSKELVFGNKNADVELVMVTSPLCFFCKKAHSDIEYLLDKLRNNIKVVIRFNVNTSNQDSLLYQIVASLLEIYNTEGESNTLKALREVYTENVDLQKWLDKQTNKTSNSFDDLLNDQHQWCKINAINFTPALYLNNRLFPQEYDRTDLIYFIDDFITSQHTQSVALVS